MGVDSRDELLLNGFSRSLLEIILAVGLRLARERGDRGD